MLHMTEHAPTAHPSTDAHGSTGGDTATGAVPTTGAVTSAAAGTSAAPRPNASVSLPSGLTADQLPRHVAMIMDGNGRWAQEHMLPSSGCEVRRGQRPMKYKQSLQIVRAHCKAQWATMGYITWAVLYGAPEALAPLAKDRVRG